MKNRILGTACALIESLRPRSWLKNVFLFAGIIFARLWSPGAVLVTALGALGFSLLAGSIYLVNDVADRRRDILHPDKRMRPVASGRLAPGTALAAAALLAFMVLSISFARSRGFFTVCLAYFIMQLLYSFKLKHVPILDCLLIAMGFVLRALAGVEIVSDAGFEITISPWLVLCTFFVAVFLAFSKRRAEVVALGDGARQHRAILKEYTPYLLDEMIGVSTSASLMCYALYTVSERTTAQVSPNLWMTVPFVAFGIYRYLYLVHMRNMGGSPEKTLLSDPPMILNILLWLGSVIAVLWFFPAPQP
ncbi:MAG TPA: decaprenyl-phosphate phosphoribosyltransferase [Candidatus Fermentibacter daniensis]|nr:decaprenyl-phosphate phosphoribosyltransferase [Candidatus Fermentibacter daniensis]HOR07588.1 decaprenyl-phosphate phosphoribosyltransferase [Candidatus Fermentibacter daniensis]HPK51510.1 decaprenyl-phosphate phosphoribosyltransferase [Candidatus Fermentibacter daniensis]HQH92248.1 decaprenyl-phosphate phosphoribosyltransferase [Candidatus Fermentibacter daniensis]